ncbi:MAG TPA: hypothetical protein VFS42_12345 [Burkholderiaceae bacterium]|nr:hypothetical protein [Burkholderiaceae bacterium]
MKQRLRLAVVFAAFALMTATSSSYAEEGALPRAKNASERFAHKADRVARKVVNAVKHGARKTGEALELASRKTGEAVGKVGHKVFGGSATGNTNSRMTSEGVSNGAS